MWFNMFYGAGVNSEATVIIWPRASVHSLRPAAMGAADTAWGPYVRHLCGGLGVRCGLSYVSDPGCQRESLQLGSSVALLRSEAEERKNAIHFRSAGSRELRPRVVSPCGLRALLVFDTASGAED